MRNKKVNLDMAENLRQSWGDKKNRVVLSKNHSQHGLIGQVKDEFARESHNRFKPAINLPQEPLKPLPALNETLNIR
jgi:hypothetical protein